MKKKWLFVPLMATAFASCEKQEQAVPPAVPTAERKTPAPTKIEPLVETAPAIPSSPADTSASAADTVESPAITTDNPPPPLPSAPAADGIPVAKAVEGKPGFVFSPYNDKVVDVRDMAPGTLVVDPAFQPSEKKHFRLPP